MTFQNQVWIITGGAGGIGIETAKLFIGAGARVILWDIHADSLQTVAEKIGADCAVVDCTDYDQIQNAIQSAKSTYGIIHGVVHGAGILHTGAFLELSPAKMAHIVTVNLTGTVNVAHACLPYLAESGGHLILLGSISAFQGAPEFATYGATKAAVYNLAQALRVELTGQGVHIGVVSPNFVNTNMLNAENRAHGAMTRSKSIFLKIYEADEIARAIMRGIQKRRFNIFTDWRGWLIHFMSRYVAWSGHFLTVKTWHDAQKGVQ